MSKLLLLLLGVPLVLAVVVASTAYAWNTFSDGAETVHAFDPGSATAGGVEPFTVNDFKVGDRVFLAVSTYDHHIQDGSMRQFLTIYEVNSKGVGKSELYLVASRCIDFDRGGNDIGIFPQEKLLPYILAKDIERAEKKQPKNSPLPKAHE
ncbi:hypothetical protein OAU50_00470 [Planctomycetota bacterium]|nr:hypothetical protein [Planctomycetota bacterium]